MIYHLVICQDEDASLIRDVNRNISTPMSGIYVTVCMIANLCDCLREERVYLIVNASMWQIYQTNY